MRKIRIQQAVAAHLAAKGYPESWHAWPKPGWLIVIKPGRITAGAYHHIPAGSSMSLRRLISILSAIPAYGPPRPEPSYMKDDGDPMPERQLAMFGDRRD